MFEKAAKFNLLIPVLILVAGLLAALLISEFLKPENSERARIDTSTDEKMKASIQEVRASLPEEKTEKFDQALRVLNSPRAFDFRRIVLDPEMKHPKALMMDAINNKTGAEIIAAAEQIKKKRDKKRDERERRLALMGIQALQKKKANSEYAQKELTKFKINRSRYYMLKWDFGANQPIIELDVVNNTAYPVSRAYFRGTLSTPGMAEPWHRDDFIFKIPGGLEPGEEAHWVLAPNMFGGWGKIGAPEDAIFTVEVFRLDGADDKPIYSVDFSELNAEHLEGLMKKYPDLAK